MIDTKKIAVEHLSNWKAVQQHLTVEIIRHFFTVTKLLLAPSVEAVVCDNVFNFLYRPENRGTT
jgi:hypothetical protein